MEQIATTPAAEKVKTPLPKPPKKPVPSKGASVKCIQGETLNRVDPTGPRRRDWESIRRSLTASANMWHMSDSDPREAIHRARKGYREINGRWPNVLQLSPRIFDDLLNDLGVIAYLATIELPSIHNHLDAHHAKLHLARYLGVRRVAVDAEYGGASVSEEAEPA